MALSSDIFLTVDTLSPVLETSLCVFVASDVRVETNITAISTGQGYACKTPDVSSLISSSYLLFNLVIEAHGMPIGKSDVIYAAYQRAELKSIYPNSCAEIGGCTVNLFGGPFFLTTTIMCSFGALGMVPATWHSDSLVTCTAPASIPGIVAVDVLTNGVDRSTNTLAFTYLPPLSLFPFHRQVDPVLAIPLCAFKVPTFITQARSCVSLVR